VVPPGTPKHAISWLSLISESNDIEDAKNQQCHYDYFKCANDQPAWALFQTVLSGTDSILNHLQDMNKG